MIRSDEWRWLAVFAAAVVLLSSLPFLIAFSQEGTAWRFGGFLFNSEDGNSYIAKMVSGSMGDWLFRSRYTTLPQAGALVYAFYTWLGKLASGQALHTQLVALYHLARSVGVIFSLVGCYLFLARFLERISLRRFGLALASLGGGLGWMIPLFVHTGDWQKDLPLEFYSPETFGFMSLLFAPHLAFARGLLLFALYFYLTPAGGAVSLSWKPGPIVWGCLAMFGLGFVQPVYLLAGIAAMAVHLALLWVSGRNDTIRRSNWQDYLIRAAWMVGISCPWLIYTYLVFRFDPYLKIWASHERLISPHPFYYLLSYGLLLPFAWLAVREIWRKKNELGLFLVGWVVTVMVMVYIPFEAQRRLAEGSWVAWVALAMASFQGLNGVKRPALKIVLLLSFLVPLLFYTATIQAALQPGPPIFLPRAKAEAYQALDNHIQPGDAVLAAYSTANELPAWSKARVLVGIGTESANLEELLPKINLFYGEEDDAMRLTLLKEHSVDIVFWGPAEDELGSWEPETVPYLEKIYDQDGYQLYAVRDDV